MEHARFARLNEKLWSSCGLKNSLFSLRLDIKARLVQVRLARLVEQLLTVAAAIADAAPGTAVALIVTACLSASCFVVVNVHSPSNNLKVRISQRQ